VLPDGTLLSGVAVFRLAYGAIGQGLLFAPTALPLLSPLFERAYAAFARNRYAVSALLTPVLVRVEAARAARRAAGACAEGVCETNQERSPS
jgi:predicted DCC family thiol-disulfide oxidoreductase YuxK